MGEVQHRTGWIVVAGVTGAAALVVVLLVDRPGGGAETARSPAESSARADPDRPAARAAGRTPVLLAPNLRSLAAADLSIETLGGERRLRFAASLANLGPGPLLLLPRGRAGCPPGRHPAVQVLHRDRNGDGVFQRAHDPPERQRSVGCMLRHPGHGHWHFDAMAAYSLRDPGTDRALAARDKVSFCLRDNRRVPGQRARAGREHFGECGRDSRQGISPGWVDVYSADLDGQWLRVPPRLDDRVVCLDLEADPHGLLAETDETDNATSIAIRIDGGAVRRAGATSCG